MAGPSQTPLPAATNPIESGLGALSKMPIYGRTEEQVQEALDAAQKAEAALEARYANPNWFNVAAGFFKPQLGGFAASLGSASQEMGNWTEQQRANEIPIYNARAQVALLKAQQSQKLSANDSYTKWLIGGADPTTAPALKRELVARGATDLADSVQQQVDVAQRVQETATSGQQASLAAQVAGARDPALHAAVKNLYSVGPQTPEAQQQAQLKIDSARPPNIPEGQWAALGRAEKLDNIDKFTKLQTEKGQTEEEKTRDAAAAANNRLPLLRNMRELALQPGMDKFFNYFGGNNPFEVIARAAADGKFGDKLSEIDKYIMQASQGPAERSNMQKLSKLIFENMSKLRSATTNPTDANQLLVEMSSPNLGNSQNAFVTLVDLIGHSEKNAVDVHNLRMRGGPDGKPIPAREFPTSDEYYKKLSDFQNEHSQIAVQDPLKATPSWYAPKPNPDTVGVPTPAARKSVTRVAPAGWIKQPNGEFKKVE